MGGAEGSGRRTMGRELDNGLPIFDCGKPEGLLK